MDEWVIQALYFNITNPFISLTRCSPSWSQSDPVQQCKWWSQSLSTLTQLYKHCRGSHPPCRPLNCHLLPDTQVHSRLTPAFNPCCHAGMKNPNNTETLITMQRPAQRTPLILTDGTQQIGSRQGAMEIMLNARISKVCCLWPTSQPHNW